MINCLRDDPDYQARKASFGTAINFTPIHNESIAEHKTKVLALYHSTHVQVIKGWIQPSVVSMLSETLHGGISQMF